MDQLDSITVDPHKTGYIPYPAGAIIFKDQRVRELIAHEAPYALGDKDQQQNGEFFLGRYILEGSKPGAAAAAVWLCHQIYPLNEVGYGNLLGSSIEGAIYFAQQLKKLNQYYEVVIANDPIETNIVCYFFNPIGNNNLEFMNQFNYHIFKKLSVHNNLAVYAQNFYISHTKFQFSEYGSKVLCNLIQNHTSIKMKKCTEKLEEKSLVVLRSTIMNPFVLSKTNEENYLDKFVQSLPEILNEVYLQQKNNSL